MSLNRASRLFGRVGQMREYHDWIREKFPEGGRGAFYDKLTPEARRVFANSDFLSDPRIIQRSALVFVTEEMVRLLQHASSTLPAFSFDPELLPWRDAIVFGEIPFFPLVVGATIGLQWGHLREDTWLVGGLGHDAADGRLFYPFTARERPGEIPLEAPTRGFSADVANRTLCSLWLLLRQRIATQRQEKPDRAIQRRYAREGRETPTVTVIELRRPVTGRGANGEGAAVDWSHRWIVGGHWRNQYHPSSQSHVPTWIAPFVKGPKDKPFVAKDRVYVWSA